MGTCVLIKGRLGGGWYKGGKAEEGGGGEGEGAGEEEGEGNGEGREKREQH